MAYRHYSLTGLGTDIAPATPMTTDPAVFTTEPGPSDLIPMPAPPPSPPPFMPAPEPTPLVPLAPMNTDDKSKTPMSFSLPAAPFGIALRWWALAAIAGGYYYFRGRSSVTPNGRRRHRRSRR
jgi:hypothetical protein